MMKLLLGNKIKALRKARGITQEQLADAISSRVKMGEQYRLARHSLALSLASYFGLTRDGLFKFNLK